MIGEIIGGGTIYDANGPECHCHCGRPDPVDPSSLASLYRKMQRDVWETIERNAKWRGSNFGPAQKHP